MAKQLDWTKTGTLVAMAEWLRERSGALAVVVVRVDDAAMAADAGIGPEDAKNLIVERAQELARELQASRARNCKSRTARQELAPNRE